jgi:hypothetical protein
VPVREDAVTILEFDDAGLIRQFRSYYDKLGMMNQIASGLPGLYGWFARKVVGSLVAQANKGLDTSGLTAAGPGAGPSSAMRAGMPGYGQ